MGLLREVLYVKRLAVSCNRRQLNVVGTVELIAVRNLCFHLLTLASIWLLFQGRSLLRCAAINALALDVVVEHSECFVDFLAQFSIVVNPDFVSLELSLAAGIVLQRQQLFVVHFQQHTSYLASKFRLQDLDLGVDCFAN